MRVLKFVLPLLICAVALAQPASSSGKQLNIVIISVENFDDEQYQNALLQTNIQKATDGLEGFFGKYFPTASLTILRTRDETTSAHLTEFFRGTFPKLANGNMALLFVLSHGEALPAPNPIYGSDLRIVASDTPATDLASKTISLTTDIVGNMQGLLPGSFVFGFIDTCHSGAAKSIGLSIDAAVKSALGTKMMLMASSLSDQLAFQASFSQALVGIWSQQNPAKDAPQNPVSSAAPKASQTLSQASNKSQPCTVPEVSQRLIRNKIQDILGSNSQLGPNEGYPAVLLHFQGAMCLETFSSQSAIVDLINGTADSYVASFTDSAGYQFTQEIEAHDATPLRLNRSPYQLAVYKDNLKIYEKRIDLTMETVHWEVVGSPDTQQLALGLERAASAGVTVGANATDVDRTRKLSYAAYVIAKDLPSAERVAQQVTDSAWTLTRQVTFMNANLIRADLGDRHELSQLEAVANTAQRAGNLKAAAKLYEEAADEAKREKSASQADVTNLAINAYFTYTANGEFAKAKEIRQNYKLPPQLLCAECKELEDKAVKGNILYGHVFSDVAAAKVLVKLDIADKQRKPMPDLVLTAPAAIFATPPPQ